MRFKKKAVNEQFIMKKREKKKKTKNKRKRYRTMEKGQRAKERKLEHC